MTVANGKKVSIEYTLTDDDGNVLDSSVGRDPLQYQHGGKQIIPGLESALDGLNVGDSKKVTVKPEDGYGVTDKAALIEVPKAQIPEAAHKVGAQLEARGPNGDVVHPSVAEIKDDTIVLDFNHPLAGKTLHFEVKIISIDD